MGDSDKGSASTSLRIKHTFRNESHSMFWIQKLDGDDDFSFTHTNICIHPLLFLKICHGEKEIKREREAAEDREIELWQIRLQTQDISGS